MPAIIILIIKKVVVAVWAPGFYRFAMDPSLGARRRDRGTGREKSGTEKSGTSRAQVCVCESREREGPKERRGSSHHLLLVMRAAHCCRFRPT